MKAINILVIAFFLNVILGFNVIPQTPDNNLIKYYSALLTINLNHSSELTKVLYSLIKEPAFDKDFLEDQLNKIQQNIDEANDDIASISINTLNEQSKAIDPYINSIDKYLANVLVDIESIRTDLKNESNISSYISDMYFQIKNAENEDHREIKRILNLKDFDEPVLVVPDQQ